MLQTNNPQYAFSGAGFALVTVNGACDNFQVTRIFRNQWYGNVGGRSGFLTPYNETFYGDHGAVLASDGFIYLFGGIPGTGSDVGLARVSKGLAFNLLAYEYWNGKAFQRKRILYPTSAIAVMNGLGQGTVFYNKYYKRYIYLSSCILIRWFRWLASRG